MTTKQPTTDYSNPRLEEHMIFICPECGAEHFSQQNWRGHLNAAHGYSTKNAADFNFKEINDLYHECLICSTWVSNGHRHIALLQYHRFSHLPYSRIYRCRHCQGTYNRKRALCDHIYRFHKHLLDESNDHGQNASIYEVQARDPTQNSEFYLRFVCPECGKFDVFFHEWLQHIDTAHNASSKDIKFHQATGTNNHFCLHCKKHFYAIDKNKLQRHRFSHLPFNKYFQCAFCPAKRMLKTEVLRHFIYAHTEEFEATKQYIKKPEEWAASVGAKLNKEIDELLAQRVENRMDRKNQPKTDLIKKALQDIDIGKEMAESSATVKRAKIDKTLMKLKATLQGDLSESQASSQDSTDFEDLCTEIFEDIENNKSRQEKAPNTLFSVETVSNEQEKEIISIEIDTLGENVQFPCHSWDRMPNKSQVLDPAQTRVVRSDELESQLENYICYLCPECGIRCAEQSAWREHVFSQHNIADALKTNFKVMENNCSYQCLTCLRVIHTSKQSELQRHRFKHTPFQAYLECRLCSTTKSSKQKILHHLQECRSHLQTNSSQTVFMCSGCGRQFATKADIQTHKPNCMLRFDCTNKIFDIDENFRLVAHLTAARERMEELAARLKKPK